MLRDVLDFLADEIADGAAFYVVLAALIVGGAALYFTGAGADVLTWVSSLRCLSSDVPGAPAGLC